MPVRKHETILIFYKNQPTYNAQGLTLKNTETKQGGCSTNYGARNEESYIQEYENWPRDVLEIPSEGSLTHPTQKPVALCEYLIKTYTNKGDLILDNCMGTGTTGVAARKLGRDFIGIEKVADFFEISKFRIEPNILKHADIVYIV
jgi:site-specific DNA-methyltransferase (adenine-specific)